MLTAALILMVQRITTWMEMHVLPFDCHSAPFIMSPVRKRTEFHCISVRLRLSRLATMEMLSSETSTLLYTAQELRLNQSLRSSVPLSAELHLSSAPGYLLQRGRAELTFPFLKCDAVVRRVPPNPLRAVSVNSADAAAPATLSLTRQSPEFLKVAVSADSRNVQ